MQRHMSANRASPITVTPVFYTGNWYAALSSDGRHVQYVDPYNSFQIPQVWNSAATKSPYTAENDTFAWLMQYTERQGGGNIQRLAFAKQPMCHTIMALYDILPTASGCRRVPDSRSCGGF